MPAWPLRWLDPEPSGLTGRWHNNLQDLSIVEGLTAHDIRMVAAELIDPSTCFTGYVRSPRTYEKHCHSCPQIHSFKFAADAIFNSISNPPHRNQSCQIAVLGGQGSQTCERRLGILSFVSSFLCRPVSR